MPYYQLEWQKKEEIRGVEIIINYASNIVVNHTEENPDEVAKKEAEKIFQDLPEFTATLKKIVTRFQKKYTKL